MRQRRFEEVLEECISAYLDGRRGVEDSLTLYPSLARQLGPLLRAAADTADVFRDLKPVAGAQERIRKRILRAASERAAARSLTSRIPGFGPRPSGQPVRWGLVATILAWMAALVVVSGPVVFELLDNRVTRREPIANTATARRQIQEIREKTRSGQPIAAADVAALAGAASDLAAATDPPALAAGDEAALHQIVQEQLVLLQQLSEASAGIEAEEIEAALALTKQLATSLGLSVDGGPDDNPAATATDGQTPEPTERATPSTTPSDQPSTVPNP